MDVHHRVGETHELEKDRCTHRKYQVNLRIRMGRLFFHKEIENEGIGVYRDEAIQDVQDDNCQGLQCCRR